MKIIMRNIIQIADSPAGFDGGVGESSEGVS